MKQLDTHRLTVLAVAQDYPPRLFHGIHWWIVPKDQDENVCLGVIPDSHPTLPSSTAQLGWSNIPSGFCASLQPYKVSANEACASSLLRDERATISGHHLLWVQQERFHLLPGD